MIRTLFAIAFVGLSLPALCEESPVGQVAFNHVAISVSDADRSAAFYRDVLGLEEIVNRTEIEGIRWLSLGEGKELHLISILKEPVSLNKAVHFALTTTNFDGLVSALRDSQVEFSNWAGDAGEITIRADGARQIFFQDPDGYWIEVNNTATE